MQASAERQHRVRRLALSGQARHRNRRYCLAHACSAACCYPTLHRKSRATSQRWPGVVPPQSRRVPPLRQPLCAQFLHVQVLRQTPTAVQNVEPQCKRSNVNKGEARTRRTNTPSCRTHVSRIFGAQAARRASLCASSQLGAPAARSKFLRTALPTSAAPMRNGPRHHAFQKSSNIAQSTSVSAEHGFRARLRQVLLLQLAHLPRARCCGLLIEFLDISLPWHAEQPHLAEWQAFFARDTLFQLHQTADAKNMAQAQAKKRASQLVQDGAEDEGLAPNTCRFVKEDLGGAATDLGDDAPPPDLAGENDELRLPSNRVALVAEDRLFLIVISSIYVLILRTRCFVHVWDLFACSGQSMCACSGSFAARSLRRSHDFWICVAGASHSGQLVEERSA